MPPLIDAMAVPFAEPQVAVCALTVTWGGGNSPTVAVPEKVQLVPSVMVYEYAPATNPVAMPVVNAGLWLQLNTKGAVPPLMDT